MDQNLVPNNDQYTWQPALRPQVQDERIVSFKAETVNPAAFHYGNSVRTFSSFEVTLQRIVGGMKTEAAHAEFADFVELVPGVGPHGRYVLKESGLPVSTLYHFIAEGFSNEEIANMLNGLTEQDVAKVHTFIDAMI